MSQSRSLDDLVAQTRSMKRHPVFRATFWSYIHLWLCSVRLDPIFARTFLLSLPPSILAALLEAFNNYDVDGGFFSRYGVYLTSDVYTVVTTLLGFLIVFRNSQAYFRFWEAATTIYQMQGELFDGASSLVAFCSTDVDMRGEVSCFRHTLIRLISLLNALMLMELQTFNEGSDGIKVAILDPAGLDQSAMKALETQACPVEVVCQWVQQLSVGGLRSGVVDVPAPIATRAFQEIGAGVLRFHEALKIAQVPFPSPYMATMMGLLVVHMILTPISITAMVDASGWAFLLTFVSVFTLWSLALLGLELDNPFKHASTRIIDLEMLQIEHNTRLLSLISAAHCPVPRLVESAKSFKELSETAALEHQVRVAVVSEADHISMGPVSKAASARLGWDNTFNWDPDSQRHCGSLASTSTRGTKSDGSCDGEADQDHGPSDLPAKEARVTDRSSSWSMAPMGRSVSARHRAMLRSSAAGGSRFFHEDPDSAFPSDSPSLPLDGGQGPGTRDSQTARQSRERAGAGTSSGSSKQKHNLLENGWQLDGPQETSGEGQPVDSQNERPDRSAVFSTLELGGTFALVDLVDASGQRALYVNA